MLIHNLLNFKKFQTEALKLPCNSSNSPVSSSPSLQISSVCEFAYGWLIQWDYVRYLFIVQLSSLILIYLRWWTCWLFVCFVYCSTTVASNIQIYAFNGLVIIGSWQDFAQNYLTLLLNGYRSAFAVVTIITISFQGFYYYYYSCPNQCKTIIHCGIGLHLRTGTFIYAKRLF